MNEIFKCLKTGTMVEVVSNNVEELNCSDRKMIKLTENTEEASTEKHIPSIEKDGEKITITIGSVEHPMDDDHWIEWVEVLTDDQLYRKYLKPGDRPVAEFVVNTEIKTVRAYCNLHGLWKQDM